MTYDEIKGYEIVTVSNSSTFRGIKTGLGTVMGRDAEIVCPRCKQGEQGGVYQLCKRVF